MDLKEKELLGESVDHHWYYLSKAKAVKKLIGNLELNTILDIGAGSGFFSKYLLKYTTANNAQCIDTSYPNKFREIYNNKTINFSKDIKKSNASLVLLMDVLEHVDDDTGLLNEYVNKVKSGSYFLISVPAFQFLWSNHDVYLEHKRRYKLSHLEKVVKQSGLSICKSNYFFGAVFPIAALIRIISNITKKNQNNPTSQLKKHSKTINQILKVISFSEVSLMRFNRLFGLTIFCLAVKK